MPRAESNDPYIGKAFGNVTLSARLGAGGMAVVYKGWHSRFDREVAVKILPPRHDEGKVRFQDRFVREGRAAARIQHRNVVQVYDAGAEHGVAYLVLEYIDGPSLGDIVDRKGALAPAAVQRLAIGIAEGLVAIHGKGIAHRDIKPDNLLLGSNGVVKIADLGLARELDDDEALRLTATGMVVGTPLYVAPEAITDGHNAGTASDIYSLGATLYHLLSGRPPFTGKTPYEIMRSHLEERIKPVRDLVPTCPKELANLVSVCLAKDPALRPDAAEVVRILRRGLGVNAGHWKPLVGLSVLAAAVVIGLSIIALQVMGRPNAGEEAAETALLRLNGLEPGMEWQLGDGDWQPARPESRIPAGVVSVSVRRWRDGVMEVWQERVTAEVGQEYSLHPRPVALTGERRTVAIPGEGLLWVAGRPVGLDTTWAVNRQGRYPVGRWDGRQWVNGVVVVDAHVARFEAAAPTAIPGGPAWWRPAVGAVPQYHLCAWAEVDRVRRQRGLASPFNWDQGAAEPSAMARRLDTALVLAVEAEHQPLGMALPDASTGQALSDFHQVPVWIRTGAAIGTAGDGHERQAVLLLVADDRSP